MKEEEQFNIPEWMKKLDKLKEKNNQKPMP
jgi:hypothetical protein